MMKQPWRLLMLAAGWICVAIGVVGIVLPGLPGTVFLIVAAWLFARSSPRFERWLLGHPRLGPQVVKWRATGAIAPGIKVIAIGSMALSWAIVWLTAPALGIAASGLCLAASALYVGTRPNA
jgi:uncharacterized protein